MKEEGEKEEEMSVPSLYSFCFSYPIKIPFPSRMIYRNFKSTAVLGWHFSAYYIFAVYIVLYVAEFHIL